MLFAGAVEVNALAQGALRRFTQWPWIEHQTFRLWTLHHWAVHSNSYFQRFRESWNLCYIEKKQEAGELGSAKVFLVPCHIH